VCLCYSILRALRKFHSHIPNGCLYIAYSPRDILIWATLYNKKHFSHVLSWASYVINFTMRTTKSSDHSHKRSGACFSGRHCFFLADTFTVGKCGIDFFYILVRFLLSFYCATRMHSADCAVARYMSVCLSVCLSVTRRYSV